MTEKNVLVVEDNSLNMKLVQNVLQIGNYRCIAADNAELGLELARKHLPDLILMDIELPGMDGLTAIKTLRKDPGTRGIPALALTAYAMDGDEARARAAGFDGYITKPFGIKDFKRSIDAILRAREGRPEEAGPPVSHHRTRILVVDDEPLNLKLLVSQLTAKGYELITARDGTEALSVVREKRPDLILLDVMMPGMDGYEVTGHLKADADTRDIPIIMITALTGEDEKKKGLKAGVDDFLNKPINGAELEARVVSLLRLRAYQQQLTSRKASERFILGENPVAACDPDTGDGPGVLIVEDDDTEARLIERCLDALPCRLFRAKDGRAALEAVQKDPIDIMLLDVVLPEMDGFAVCRQIKESEERHSVQIVMTTHLQDLDSKIRGIEMGADDFLIKPVNREELRARVRSLGRKKAYLDRLRERVSNALQAAITDELTTIYNCAYFKHFLDLEIKRSRRQKHTLALLMIDVDNFKQYNDTLGHPAGDRFLRRLGALLRKNLREIDLAARYGGEEFAVVLPYTGSHGAMDTAQRLVAAVADLPRPRSREVSALTISIGIAVFPLHEETTESLIRRADQALYRAKRTGKNRACFKVGEACDDDEDDAMATDIKIPPSR